MAQEFKTMAEFTMAMRMAITEIEEIKTRTKGGDYDLTVAFADGNPENETQLERVFVREGKDPHSVRFVYLRFGRMMGNYEWVKERLGAFVPKMDNIFVMAIEITSRPTEEEAKKILGVVKTFTGLSPKKISPDEDTMRRLRRLAGESTREDSEIERIEFHRALADIEALRKEELAKGGHPSPAPQAGRSSNPQPRKDAVLELSFSRKDPGNETQFTRIFNGPGHNQKRFTKAVLNFGPFDGASCDGIVTRIEMWGHKLGSVRAIEFTTGDNLSKREARSILRVVNAFIKACPNKQASVKSEDLERLKKIADSDTQ